MPRRARTATVVETVTVDGVARTVAVPYAVPRAPADWDRRRSAAATAGTVLVVCGALAWSVAAIGDLLSALAPTWLAYVIAGVFDLAWIICMVSEYELRFSPGRQRGPRVLGWALLAVSISVIFVHGVRVADVVVALAGSAVAVLAKILWHMRVQINRRTLNPATQAWLDTELDDAEAALLVTAARRRIGRAQARVGTELAALTPGRVHPGAPVPVPPNPQVRLEGSGAGTPAPVRLHLVSEPAPPDGLSGRAALAAMLAQIPPGDTRSISELARTYAPLAGVRESYARRCIGEMRNARQGSA